VPKLPICLDANTSRHFGHLLRRDLRLPSDHPRRDLPTRMRQYHGLLQGGPLRDEDLRRAARSVPPSARDMRQCERELLL
jgi:hypothetical protein